MAVQESAVCDRVLVLEGQLAMQTVRAAAADKLHAQRLLFFEHDYVIVPGPSNAKS